MNAYVSSVSDLVKILDKVRASRQFSPLRNRTCIETHVYSTPRYAVTHDIQLGTRYRFQLQQRTTGFKHDRVAIIIITLRRTAISMCTCMSVGLSVCLSVRSHIAP